MQSTESPAKGFYRYLSAILLFILSLFILTSLFYKNSCAFVEKVVSQHRWTGDLDTMKERRLIRVLVVYDNLFYFMDRGRQFGFSYEYIKEFEKFINRRSPVKGREK